MLPGTVIADRYRVVRLLGEGGMGAVYEGEHIAVGRRVAIKVLHPNFAKKDGVLSRFEREARAAAAIGHDNITDVFDFGTHEGAPFMVMEFLRGESLSARLERGGRLPVEQAALIMGQVLSALGAAHNVGIVHRDLKPDNVFLIAKGGQADFVKVIDFGISKFNDQSEGAHKSVTKPGVLMGTPYYMAPEQALAKPDIDGRADVYSAGVMLYEMLTGSLPFEANSETELLMMICHRTREPRSVRESDPAIPPELEAVVVRAMAFDRDARFATAGEMLDALRPFGAIDVATVGMTGSFRAVHMPTAMGTPMAWITAGGGSPVEGAARPLAVTRAPIERRKGVLLAVGGALAISAALGSVLLFRGGSSTAASRPPAAAPAPAPAAREPATVRVELADLPEGARVWLDGQETAERTLALPRRSSHRLRIEAPGRQPYESSFVAERSETMRIALAEASAVRTTGASASRAGSNTANRGARAAPRAGQTAGSNPGRPNQGRRPAGSLLPATEEY